MTVDPQSFCRSQPRDEGGVEVTFPVAISGQQTP
jgi:hypothetical protein